MFYLFKFAPMRKQTELADKTNTWSVGWTVRQQMQRGVGEKLGNYSLGVIKVSHPVLESLTPVTAVTLLLIPNFVFTGVSSMLSLCG